MTNESDVETCACCGRPTTSSHTHHVNERKADNYPDNLSPRDSRCHMRHHGNDTAAEAYSRNRHLPAAARAASPRPTDGPR